MKILQYILIAITFLNLLELRAAKGEPITSENNQLIKVLQKDYPDLVINTVHFYDEGHSNKVFEVNNTVLFRFYKKKNNVKQRLQSIALLKYLKNKITAVQIPNIIYEGKNHLYIGYEKIKGNPLLSLRVLSKEQQELLAIDVARFLAELHDSTILKYAYSIKAMKRNWTLRAVEIATLLRNKKSTSNMAQLAERLANEYKALSNKNSSLALIHGDLHGGNIVVDPVTKKIKGVFDFDQLRIGDINEDFNWFYKKRQSAPFFFDALVKQYTKLTGKKLNLRAMARIALLRELHRVAHFDRDSKDKKYKQEVYTTIASLQRELGL